ncbi:MAG: hypothetical protein LC772_04620, partial [Chloroflexi bacterium]|nr:hypothetical protein [Chloroflexota bacterium]
AAIIHTELEPDVLEKVTTGLLEAGYEPRVVSPARPGGPPDLAAYQFLVVDERVGNRSGLEILVHILTDIDTQEVPACLLCSDPWDSTVYTCVSLGAALVLNKKSRKSMDGLPGLFRWVASCAKGGRKKVMWPPFTERAKALVIAAQDLAAGAGDNHVKPEHLLAAILCEPDCVACKVIEEFGAPREGLRQEMERNWEPVSGSGRKKRRRAAEVTIHPRLQKVLNCAFAETRIASTNYLGTEHLLLALLWDTDGPAGQALAHAGLELEGARKAVALHQPQ